MQLLKDIAGAAKCYYELARWHTLYRHRITLAWPNLKRWVDLGGGNSALTDDLHMQVESAMRKLGITDWQVRVTHYGVLKRTFTIGFRNSADVLLVAITQAGEVISYDD